MTTEFSIFESDQLPTFILKKKLRFFREILPEKGVSRSKQDKLTLLSNSGYSNQSQYQLSSSCYETFILIFWTKFVQRIFPLQSKTNDHYHLIQLIRISLYFKFHLIQTIFIYWTNVAEKGQKKDLLFVSSSPIQQFFTYHQTHLLKKNC